MNQNKLCSSVQKAVEFSGYVGEASPLCLFKSEQSETLRLHICCLRLHRQSLAFGPRCRGAFKENAPSNSSGLDIVRQIC